MKEKRQSQDVEAAEEGEENNCPSIQERVSLSYEDKLKYVNAISKPIAHKKLARRLYRLIKKSSKQKNYLRRGIKLVQRQIRKGERGIVVIAGDVTPIEILCHLPAVCEELGMPYIYTPSKADIGEALGVARPMIVVLIKEHEDYKDLYQECKDEIDKLPLPI